ncbi:MAG TPA: hypothetical protein VLG09_06290 [Candidatus Saccharimonadales bacterium]|nr:hypothetical protein [Candidatus Saccharimonadales bacterium]
MGLFQSKQSKKTSPADEVTETVATIFDEQYREELRNSGRAYFKKAMEENVSIVKQDLDVTIVHVGTELRDYMTTRLDTTIAHVDAELVKRLDERLAEYDRITKDAQDLAVQSLNRNAQALHEKYQQLSQSLQQTIASQEAMMIATFEENKARITVTEDAQEKALQSLENTAETSQQQSEQLNAALQKNITDQETKLSTVYQENIERVTATKDAQEAMLQSLKASEQALQEQREQLNMVLEKTIVEQEAVMVEAFENNMAQIIEHYLLGALSDQYDLKAQLPSIIKQMEANKQTIVDDMKS